MVQKAITVGGREYCSIRQACRQLGVSYPVVMWRLQHGHGVEDAFASRRIVSSRPVRYEGVTYASIRGACKALDLAYSTIHARMQGSRLEGDEAFGYAVDYDARLMRKRAKAGRKGIAVEIEGVRYPSLLGACQALGVSYSAVLMHRKRHAVSTAEALRCLQAKQGSEEPCA